MTWFRQGQSEKNTAVICIYRHTQTHTAIQGLLKMLQPHSDFYNVWHIVFSGPNTQSHTEEISQVASAAIINLKNATVTFIIADANSVLYRGPGIHQQLCAIQPSMGRESDGGGANREGEKRRGRENHKYSMKLCALFCLQLPPPPLAASRKTSKEINWSGTQQSFI